MQAVLDRPVMLSETTPKALADAQLAAIKERAMELWGNKWSARICGEYCRIMGINERQRYAQIQMYFKGERYPSHESLNALMMAVNCRITMQCFNVETLVF